MVDAWLHGMPVVTTPIGAEGLTRGDTAASPSSVATKEGTAISPSSVAMQGDAAAQEEGKETEGWGGLYSAADADAFAADAVCMHEDAELWASSREAGQRLLTDLFDASTR